MKKQLIALSLVSLATTAQASDCGRVQIAEMNWASAQLIANVDKFILEHGFDCDAELVPGDTVPTATSMIEKQEPDIAPELWINSFKEGLENAVADGSLSAASKVFKEGGQEGLWIPKYMVDENPELATIEGIKANPELFPHPEDDSKAGFMTCPPGWACQIISGNLFKALDLAESNFEVVDPGSAAGLDGSLIRAYERGQGWFGYYWSPTAILGKYPMVMVDFGTGVDEEEFLTCTTQTDCLDPKPTMWPESPVYTYTTAELGERAPQVMEYLNGRAFSNNEMNELIAWMADNQADGEIGAYHFLTEYPDLWKGWLAEDVIAKVEAEL